MITVHIINCADKMSYAITFYAAHVRKPTNFMKLSYKSFAVTKLVLLIQRINSPSILHDRNIMLQTIRPIGDRMRGIVMKVYLENNFQGMHLKTAKKFNRQIYFYYTEYFSEYY